MRFGYGLYVAKVLELAGVYFLTSRGEVKKYETWGKIASIEYVGEEQVYDIEVERTHNFVANGIIAHK